MTNFLIGVVCGISGTVITCYACFAAFRRTMKTKPEIAQQIARKAMRSMMSR